MKLLEFEFKGDRKYVHGTDMINKFLDTVQGYNSLSIQIRKITTKNLYVVEASNNLPLVANISLNVEGGSIEKYYLVESDQDAKGRYSYNEEKLVESAEIDSESEVATIKYSNTYSLVENIVALHKKLVNQIISSDVKWLFVELKLNLSSLELLKGDLIAIRIKRKLGFKLVESIISINKVDLGVIRFSSINKR